MENNFSPLLSVCLITYNHAIFINQAIEGVLMQKVDFSWEIIIADDCSTDGTRDTLINYQKKYPHLIKLILQEKNVGAAKNWQDLITKSKSKYIAYLEGDDYWTSPLKLQKQMDIFHRHPDTILCGTRAKIWDENKQEFTGIAPALNKDVSCMTPEQFFYQGGWIKSCTRVVPRELLLSIPPIYSRDYRQVHYLLAKNPNGRIRCLDEVMAVYREHVGGVFSGANPIDLLIYNLESKVLLAKLYSDERSNNMKERAAEHAKELAFSRSLARGKRFYYARQYLLLKYGDFSKPGVKRILRRSFAVLSSHLNKYPGLKKFLRFIYLLAKGALSRN
jgi:glycosyltransferase involved in cell wall biosynthesis